MVSFFVLAYALAWGGIPWNSFFAPGVLVAALVIVSITEGPAGLKRLGSRIIRWRVSWVWYALAIAVPLLAHLAATSLNVALGAGWPSLDLLTPWYSLPMAIGLHIIDPTGGPVMEEPSFRGYAQPKLMENRSPLTGTVMMAILVAGWHLPLFLMPVFKAPLIGFVTTLAVTFWYCWLLNHASLSSLITLIAHGTEGAIGLGQLWPAGDDLTRQNWTYCFIWCLVAVSLVVLDRKFWAGKVRPGVDPSRQRQSVSSEV
jgi:membrane protease YdiL (CAAX protease family)